MRQSYVSNKHFTKKVRLLEGSISITYIEVFGTLMITYAASSVYLNANTIELAF